MTIVRLAAKSSKQPFQPFPRHQMRIQLSPRGGLPRGLESVVYMLLQAFERRVVVTNASGVPFGPVQSGSLKKDWGV